MSDFSETLYDLLRSYQDNKLKQNTGAVVSRVGKLTPELTSLYDAIHGEHDKRLASIRGEHDKQLASAVAFIRSYAKTCELCGIEFADCVCKCGFVNPAAEWLKKNGYK